MENIHTRIRRRREELGMSKSELARKVNVSYQTIQQWEREPVGMDSSQSAAPKRMRQQAVAEALGVTVNWLVTGNDDDGNAFDPQRAQLLDLYDSGDDEWKALIVEQMNMLHNLRNPEASKANPYGVSQNSTKKEIEDREKREAPKEKTGSEKA